MHEYRKEEQPNTAFDLDEKIKMYGNDDLTKRHDIIVEFDCNQLNSNNFQTIVNLSEILQESGEVGEMEYEIFKFNIKALNTYEKDLILVK
jgi:hypothetical protein